MTNAKHTPTPWKTDGYYIETSQETIASCGTSTLTVAEDHANAAHIVKCVNMHDELVEALKNLHVAALQSDVNDMSNDYGCDALSAAYETLKKAGAL